MSITSIPSNPTFSGQNGWAESVVQQQKRAKTAPVTTSLELMHKEKYELTISEEAIVRAVEKANKALAGFGKRFEYNIHEKTGDIIVKVYNADTNELIREIPPEKILDLVAKLQEICGVIVDEKR